MVDRVAVLGGGVAGLTAAHELAEATDFEVTVYERNPIAGGKARSFGKPGTGGGGRRELPCEHGFRFFPGYYRNIPHTMRRISLDPDSGATVFDNLVAAQQTEMRRTDGPPVTLPNHFPKSMTEVCDLFGAMFAVADIDIPGADLLQFARVLRRLFCSSDARRFGEFESVSWLDMSVGGAERSPAYLKYLADGLNQRTVAASGREVSARTVGVTLVRIMYDWSKASGSIDRVLNQPTNDAWIDPWRTLLESLGVQFELSAEVVGLTSDGERVTGATVRTPTGDRAIDADWYIAALPAECAAQVLRSSALDGPLGLEALADLSVQRMNGVQFFLKKKLEMAHGHTIYVDSPFALTSICQNQFWQGFDMATIGGGDVTSVLSVDVSDWDTACASHGHAAQDMTRDEVVQCVWHQLKDHVNAENDVLADEDLLDAYLDPAITDRASFTPGQPRTDNREPLFINTVDSWSLRPTETTALANLFLAADYVRTKTDLATMESANEAARLAVRALLRQAGRDQSLVEVLDFPEPPVFEKLRKWDAVAYKLGIFDDGALPDEWGPADAPPVAPPG